MIGLTFKQSLQKGYTKPLRNKNYLKYVSSLTCPCGAPADEAHHIIDVGFGGGMGTKASDAFVFPVCRTCHTEIHQYSRWWEGIYGSQWEHVALTLAQAIEDGAIEL